jgi:hypothetical protein
MPLVRRLTERCTVFAQHRPVRRGLALAIAVGVGTPAAAESTADAPTHKDLYERLWPRTPDAQRVKLSDQICDQLTELGNLLGYHMDVLSRETVALRVDARNKRAWVSVGAGDERYLTFKLSSAVLFTEGMARVNTHVDLSIRGRRLELQLPEVEMEPASYKGEKGVEIRLPLFRRRF